MGWNLSWAFIALFKEPDIREFAKSLAALKLDFELCCLFLFAASRLANGVPGRAGVG